MSMNIVSAHNHIRSVMSNFTRHILSHFSGESDNSYAMDLPYKVGNSYNVCAITRALLAKTMQTRG